MGQNPRLGSKMLNQRKTAMKENEVATIRWLPEEDAYLLSVRDASDDDIWRVVIGTAALEQIYVESAARIKELQQ